MIIVKKKRDHGMLQLYWFEKLIIAELDALVLFDEMTRELTTHTTL